MSQYINNIKKKITKLANTNGMYAKGITMPNAYGRILSQILRSKFTPEEREPLLNSLLAIKANCATKLYQKFWWIENKIFNEFK